MKIKICGMTNLDDALCAAENGADYLGFIFAPSKRRVDINVVGSIIETLDKKGFLKKITPVAVFVNEDPVIMNCVLKTTGINCAQIHGDESSAQCNAFDFSWYKVIRVKDSSSAILAAQTIKEFNCPLILVDALSQSAYGGTGETVDIDAAQIMKKSIHDAQKEFFLAGGITPENVKRIVDETAPDGIDLSSGVEEFPGKKSHDKIRQLFKAVTR